MKDPARLIEHTTDSELVRLLRAGRDETPSAQALQRTLRAVAVGGGVAVSSLAAAAHNAAGTATLGSTSASAATAGSAVTSSAIGASSGVLAAGSGITSTAGAGAATAGTFGAKVLVATGVAKWMGLGALTAATATFVPDAAQWVSQMNQSPPSHVGEPPKASVVGARQKTAPAAPPISQAKSEAPVLDPKPEGEVAPLTAVKKVTPIGASSVTGAVGALRSRVAEPSAASDFAQQVEVVEQARRAIAQADAVHGLKLLADYEHRYARDQLLPEVLVLRLDALQQLGRTFEAQAVARRILQRGATGVHAERARVIVGE